MATPMTADQFKTALINEGCRVVEHHPDWATHNRNSVGAWGPTNGVMIHHTAGVGPDMADYIWNGDSSLPGPLAQGYISKDGVIHLTGWGRANHAGSGDSNVLAAVIAESYGSAPPAPTLSDTDGNTRFVGFECENLGDGVDPYPAVQLTAMKKAAAAVCRFYGWSAKSTIGHKEWTNTKIDPTFSMATFRTDVQTLLNSPAPGPITDPTWPVEDGNGTLTTWYAIYDSGKVERISARGDGPQPVLAGPGRYVTLSEYNAAVAAVQSTVATARANRDATQNTNLKADYDALRALGVSDASARRMSGYTGP